MAQDRLFHKSLGHGERVNQLTDFEYIVWGCYVLSADDYGVMRFSALTLQSDHDRLAAKNTSAIERALSRCVSVGLLGRFEHQGRGYLYQPDWQDYQKIRFPSNTTNPLPPSDAALACSAKTRDLFTRHPKFQQSGDGEATEVDPKSLRSSSEVPPRESVPLRVVNTEDANGNATANALRERESERKPTRKDREFGRIFVHGWQQHALIASLGPHAADFRLDEFLESLSARADAQGVTFPNKDIRWAWIQAQLADEVRRRGLPVASADTAPTNKRIAGLMAGGEAFLRRVAEQKARESA